MGLSVLIASRIGPGAQVDAFFFARSLVLECIEAIKPMIHAPLIPGVADAQRRGPQAMRPLAR